MRTRLLSAVAVVFAACQPVDSPQLEESAVASQAASVPVPVQRWQNHCNRFRPAAEASLSAKRASNFPHSPLPNGTTVQDVVRTGAATAVFVGGASTFPGSENQAVFFQNFTKNGQTVQLYALQRKDGSFYTFDVSGLIAQAYGSSSFTSGQTGSNSVLGLPNSGRQILNPHDTSDWHVTAFSGTPEVAAMMQAKQAFGYQEFEGGLLAEVGGGIRAFRFDPSNGSFRAMGTAWPNGSMNQGGFPPIRALPNAAYVQAGRFMINGQLFKHVGGNLSQLVYDHPDRIWDELTQAHAAGIRNVRVFLPNSALTAQQVGDRLAVVLGQAAAKGMKVTVALTSFARQEFYTTTSPQFMGGHNGSQGSNYSGAFAVVKGDEPHYDWLRRPDGALELGHPVVQNAWFQQGYRNNFRPFAETIVDRFKDDPTVFAWEIANEMKSYGRVTTDAPDFSAVKAFYADMVARIRARAPRHLVSAGLTNSREFVGDDLNERRRFLRQFDFISVHQYVASGTPMNQDAIDTDVALAWELGRPTVLGEFGFFGGVPSEQTVRAYMTKQMNEKGFDAIVPWAAGPYGEDWWKTFGTAKFNQVTRDAAASYQAWNSSN